VNQYSNSFLNSDQKKPLQLFYQMLNGKSNLIRNTKVAQSYSNGSHLLEPATNYDIEQVRLQYRDKCRQMNLKSSINEDPEDNKYFNIACKV
jgi:hypothetical protein